MAPAVGSIAVAAEPVAAVGVAVEPTVVAEQSRLVPAAEPGIVAEPGIAERSQRLAGRFCSGASVAAAATIADPGGTSVAVEPTVAAGSVAVAFAAGPTVAAGAARLGLVVR